MYNFAFFNIDHSVLHSFMVLRSNMRFSDKR